MLITACANGEQMKPYLLFPGTDLSVVPLPVLESESMFGNFSEKGWMDKVVFQAWMLCFIEFVKERQIQCGEYGTTLLLLDGHNSRMDTTTLFTTACNGIIVLCGPSQLTNLWQPNDAGTNKAFKENLNKIIAPHIEAKMTVSSTDLALFIQQSLMEPNMPRAKGQFFSTLWSLLFGSIKDSRDDLI